MNLEEVLLEEFKMEAKKRQTAFKIWISSLLNGEYVRQEGWDPNYILLDDKKISRVNIIANVINKFKSDDGNYASLLLDDGSGVIRAKTWKEDTVLVDDLENGDMVLIIGRPREFNDEIYLNPEIIKKVDNPNWELVRKLELLKEWGKPKLNVNEIQVFGSGLNEENSKVRISENNRQKVLHLIEIKADESGANREIIIEESKLDKDEVELIIGELLKEGEIFQPTPGKIKCI